MRNSFILIVLLASAASYTYFVDFKSTPARPGDHENIVEKNLTAAPDFSFTDLNDQSRDLKDFAGKAVIINFWASWCAPCVIELPQMLDLAKQTQGDAVYIFLSLDENIEDVRRFLTKYKKKTNIPNVYIGLDRDKSISRNLFGTHKIPETYLINADLKITDKIIGADIVWNDKDMISRIKEMARP